MLLEISSIPKDVEIQSRLTDIHIGEWLQEDVLQLRWWVLVCALLLLLVTWWIMLDKSRIRSISLYMFLAAIVSMGIHEYGEELVLWDYPIDIIPIFPPLSSVNLILLPLVYSLLYQHFQTRKSFFRAAGISTGIICLIIEPLLSWMGLFQLIRWHYAFSIPIYFFAALAVRAVVNKILAITANHKEKESDEIR